MTAVPARRGKARNAVFVVFMLLLMVLFAALGVWQMSRLSDKEALIAAVAERMEQPALPLPPAADWASLDARALDYAPVVVTGRYEPSATVLAFTSLGEARGRFSGPGYWVMTPFVLATGGTVFVNRGFIPEASKAEFAAGGTTDAGTVTLTGTARLPEAVGAFTPAADAANRIDWVRNIDRLARFAEPSLVPFAPVYIDLPAGEGGALPQGGETVLEFPNNHLGYALTWFGFALLTPVLLGFWLARQRRKP